MKTQRLGWFETVLFVLILTLSGCTEAQAQPSRAEPTTVETITTATPESDTYQIPDLKPYVFELVPLGKKYHNPHEYQVVIKCDDGSRIQEAVIDTSNTHDGFNGSCVIWRIGE